MHLDCLFHICTGLFIGLRDVGPPPCIGDILHTRDMAMHEGGTESPANGTMGPVSTQNSHGLNSSCNDLPEAVRGSQRPVLEIAEPKPANASMHGTADACGVDLMEGDGCLESENHDTFHSHHLPSPKMKPSHGSPKKEPQSPGSSSKPRGMVHARSYGRMEFLVLDEQVSMELNGTHSHFEEAPPPNLTKQKSAPEAVVTKVETCQVSLHNHNNHGKDVLEHTIGTVNDKDDRVEPRHEPALRMIRRSVSTLDLHHDSEEEEDEEKEVAAKRLAGENLLVVFDMDHTMVRTSLCSRQIWHSREVDVFLLGCQIPSACNV